MSAPPPEGCPFCRIATGTEQAHLVHEDDAAVAFLNHAPASRGHTLVVPRAHVVDLWDASPAEAAAVAGAVHSVAALLRERLRPDGLTVRQNNGTASGQRVFHLHVHLVPRWHGDGHIGWPAPSDEEHSLADVAALLRG